MRGAGEDPPAQLVNIPELKILASLSRPLAPKYKPGEYVVAHSYTRILFEILYSYELADGICYRVRPIFRKEEASLTPGECDVRLATQEEIAAALARRITDDF